MNIKINLKNSAVILLSAYLTVIGCSKSRAPLLQGPPEEFEALTLEAGETKSIPDPKVNILFVVDNSGSMQPHQELMKKNISLFANRFLKNARVDYKIGVIPVFDSKYLNDKKVYPRGGLRKMTPENGILLPLKDKSGNIIPNVAPYITRETPNAKEVLESTVAIGVQWGPEAEESYSPVVEIITNKKNNDTINQGFYDKDAYLVVIFLTDVDDATNGLTSFEFYNFLVQEKGSKNKVLIAAAIPDMSKGNATCLKGEDGPLHKFPELIEEGAMLADLCSDDFGSKLADFGQTLVERVARQDYILDFSPDLNIEVRYGTKSQAPEDRELITRGVNGGYYFFPANNHLVFPADMKITRVQDGELFVTATPLKVQNRGTKRLELIGGDLPEKKLP